MLEPAVVERIELGELLVGHLVLGHPESLGNFSPASEALVRFAVGIAHQERARRDAHQFHREAMPQVHCPRDRTTADRDDSQRSDGGRLAALGLRGIKGQPATARVPALGAPPLEFRL